MSTLRTLDKSTLHKGCASGASKGPTIGYVKDKVVHWTTYHML